MPCFGCLKRSRGHGPRPSAETRPIDRSDDAEPSSSASLRDYIPLPPDSEIAPLKSTVDTIDSDSSNPDTDQFDVVSIQFEQYSLSSACKAKEQIQPRCAFVSLTGFWRAWSTAPFDIIHSAILILNYERGWIFDNPYLNTDTPLLSRETAAEAHIPKQTRILQKILRKGGNRLFKAFLSCLLQKERQGLLFWAIDTLPIHESSSDDRSPISPNSPLHHTSVPDTSANNSGNTSGGSSSTSSGDTLCTVSSTSTTAEQLDSDNSTIRSFNSSGSLTQLPLFPIAEDDNSNYETKENKLPDAKWLAVSKWVSNIRDPVRRCDYYPLILSHDWWENKYRMAAWCVENCRPMESLEWEQIFTQLEHCMTFESFKNELSHMRYRYNPLMEILHVSNPTLIPMAEWDDSLWRRKALEIVQFQTSLIKLGSHRFWNDYSFNKVTKNNISKNSHKYLKCDTKKEYQISKREICAINIYIRMSVNNDTTSATDDVTS